MNNPLFKGWYKLNSDHTVQQLPEGELPIFDEDRRVDFTEFNGWVKSISFPFRKKANFRVSTVFLGLDHSFSGGVPVLFESMVFGGKHDNWMERYTTWDDAKKGHANIVKALKKDKDPGHYL